MLLLLPLNLGGMGLRKHEDTCIYAFIGAAARATQRFNITQLHPSTPLFTLSSTSPYAIHITSTQKEIISKYPSIISEALFKPLLIPTKSTISSFVDYYSWKPDNQNPNGHSIVPHLRAALSSFYNQSLINKLTVDAPTSELARIVACAAPKA